MKQEILITLDANEKQVAILQDGRLEEFYIERAGEPRMFGNIYKGRVKSVVPGIGAAFVDLGTKKDGFLYVTDALKSPLDLETEYGESPETSSEADTRWKRIDEVLKVGQEVIVQVVKEPIRNKGPRLTTHFSFPARYLVMMPGAEKVGVSRRIDDRLEREKIRKALAEIEKPKGAGFIVRTAGEGKGVKEFHRDIRYLAAVWDRVQKEIKRRKGPCVIHRDADLVERVIRDYLTEEATAIVVDHPELFHRARRFCQVYVPGQKVDLRHYRDRTPLFEKYSIEKEVERTFQKNVVLKSGGHIVIEQTEGLVAIDVNTGKFTGRRNLEETVYQTNIEAAWEVARQLRLRDAGGIIIIDFIDMERANHRRELFRVFKEAVKKDRAKTNIVQMSELGLVEMTRQRMRPSLESAVYETCAYCEGKGMVKSATTMAIQTVKEIRKSIGTARSKILNVYVHPRVTERLLHQEKKAVQSIERNTQSRIFIFAEPSLHLEDVNITFVK
ncbi:MAG: Rne/Rng family ribonuclease [Candidatus Omnitrophica bacterium]|nr:Rne/Rng family ribonuclease [Candidatus Omnitrophota bacterium]